jgi:replicative DNA helicase
MAEAPKLPPCDIELEQGLLGALLVAESAFWQLEDGLGANDFYDPLHQRIFEMIGDRMKRRMGVTPLTLFSAMRDDPGLAEVGGLEYLAGLAQAAPAMSNLKSVARLLRDLSHRRALIDIAEDIRAAAFDPPPSDTGGAAEAIVTASSERLYDLGRRSEPGRGAVALKELSYEAILKAEHAMNSPGVVCLTSGLAAVDAELGGIYRGDLLVLAGAPNMGKSAFAQMTAIANAAGQPFGRRRGEGDPGQPQPTLFNSLEMADWQLGMRNIADLTDIPSSLLRRGQIGAPDVEQMMAAHAAMPDLPLWIDSSTKLSVAQIRARAHATRRRKGGLALLVIDHLRFIRPANVRDDERDQIQQITSDLKDLAKELDVAIMLLAHLNREYSRRSSKRPINSDLYGASAIEQNADAIWFLHSESYFLEREDLPTDPKERVEWINRQEREKGWMEVFSTKARMDKIGKTRVRFEAAFTRFSDPDEQASQGGGPTRSADLLSRANEPLDGVS